MSSDFKIDSSIMKLDLYQLFGIEFDSSEFEIKSAYRKKALKCHPDKNPDNPLAAEEFHKLSSALELLLNKTTKELYDKALKARKAAEVRNRQLDSKRRKFKEDLEAREKAAQSEYQTSTIADEMKLKVEIDRLRKEGAKYLFKEQEAIQKIINEERNRLQSTDNMCRIKLHWLKNREPKYNDELLKSIFRKELAVNLENGLPGNPITVAWINKEASKTLSRREESKFHDDFESLVFRQLRQAEERRKLTEELRHQE